jgi:glycopeptide antibiotics resistance protein
VALHRRWLARALAAWTFFIVYGSLMPLQWQPQPLADAWQTFISLPLPKLGLTAGIDAAVNFLLTVPLAFGLALLLAPATNGSRNKRLRAAVGLLAAGIAPALLSLSVEFAQVFFPPRSPSWSDVFAQWSGMLAGLALYMRYRRRAAASLQALGEQGAGGNLAARWLAVWLAGMLLFNLMPLDLSIDPVELYRKWRDGRVLLLPFSARAASVDEFIYGWVSDVLLWVPVGALWRIDGQRRNLRQIVLRGMAVALAMELMQVFVMSRVSDVTDVLLAGTGVLLGAALVDPLRRAMTLPDADRRRWLLGAAAVWLLVAAVLLWQPFDFRPSRLSADTLSDAFLRVPFTTYLNRSEFGSLNEILRKLLVFLPGGLLLGAAWAGKGAVPRWPLAALVATAFVLEAGQMALTGKVADLTDALLGCLGAWLGWRIARQVAGSMLDSTPYESLTRAPDSSPRAVRRTAPAAAMTRDGFIAWSVASIVLLAMFVWTLGKLPGLPYNLAKLVPMGAQGAVAAGALAIALWWMLAAPLLVLGPSRRAWRLRLPLIALAHALVSFILLRLSVPLEMLHKLVGTPVLAWGGWWEDAGRYVALHLSVMMPLLGGMLLAHTLWRPACLAWFIGWFFSALLLFWPLHAVVVVWAGTDNLVELMRGGGSVLGSLALAGAVAWAAAAASAVALALAQPGRRPALAAVALLGLLLAPVLAWTGLENQLLKYGDNFSALQFLLSASRESYASGSDLAVRAVIAGAAFLLCTVALQFPLWRRLATQVGQPQATPASRLGRLRAA